MHKPVVRLFVLAVLLVNQLLITLGYEPFPATEEQLYDFFSTVVLGVVAVWTFWKNNSFTKEAKQADELLKKMKAKKKGE